MVLLPAAVQSLRTSTQVIEEYIHPDLCGGASETPVSNRVTPRSSAWTERGQRDRGQCG